LLFGVVALSLGCGGVDTPEWVIRFADPSLGTSATLVRARILAGGCTGTEVLHEVDFAGDGPPERMPPLLEDGRYGFAAEGLDDQCRVVAAGCAEVDLPAGDRIVTELETGSGIAECPPGTCNAGVCEDTGVVALATGRAHTCAADFGERVYCWGRNETGQVGDGAPGPDNDQLQPVEILSDFPTRLLGAGGIDINWRSHSCALRGGQVYCWGYNAQGQVGDGSTEIRARPTEVAEIDDASWIGVGGRHTCAARESGEVWCWGHDDFGQVGDGAGETMHALPVRTNSISSAVQVVAGLQHSCVRVVAGEVFCWGDNESGQLGDGTNDSRDAPVSIGLRVVTDIDAGSRHSCAVMNDATVRCWGTNNVGQLGQGPSGPASSNRPLEVMGLADVVDVATGAGMTCARQSGGQLLCWGGNVQGQTGTGPGSVDGPTPVMEIGDAIALDLGNDHGCVIRESGQLWCWGRNQYGRLGDGTTEDRFSPVAILGPGL
jgi:alpha-tubulin suppressor-like RCC1 family protein